MTELIEVATSSERVLRDFNEEHLMAMGLVRFLSTMIFVSAVFVSVCFANGPQVGQMVSVKGQEGIYFVAHTHIGA